jgi:metal-responsive CopG/Arc/MetJ family transcriptional regulator
MRCMQELETLGSPLTSKDSSPVRASISFPSDVYRTLEQIARRKKVSLAWVVREAAEQYVEGQTPLFGGRR